MLDRIGWIAAGGLALIAGIAWNGGIGVRIWHDRDSVAESRHNSNRDTTIAKGHGDNGSPIVIADTVVAGDSPEGRAIAKAMAALVRAELRLAKLDILDETDPQTLAQAHTERDRSKAELERLTAAYEAREKGPDRHKLREAVRSEVREALR